MTKNMKTVKEWLETIPDQEVRERALANCDERTLNRQTSFKSLADVVKAAFEWKASNEGREYWQDKHIVLSRQTPEPLPEPTIPYHLLDGE